MSRRLALACAALALAWVLYAVFAIKDFSGPLVGPRDTNYFEYLGYHLLAHYKFGFPPEMGFVGNDVGYWQGGSIVYLSWCAERDLLCMLLLRTIGAGPWIQAYSAISPGIGAFGTLFLLRREFGVTRAALVAFAANFMAFYAVYKYPYHVNMTALHWGVLSIVCDFLITRRVVKDERIPASLLLLRFALMLLLIGLDLGYVAGYPLTFFTISFAFWIARYFFSARKRGIKLRDYLPEKPLADLQNKPFLTSFSVAGILLGALVYVPFAFAVVQGSRIYKFDGPGGWFWTMWLRMLVPFLPGVNPSSRFIENIFGDAEGLAEYSVGWSLLGFAILGVVHAKKNRTLTMLVPLLVTFVVCFAFHPKRLPTLHVFPWFAFNRVSGRATVFFPLFFALIAIDADFSGKSKRAIYTLFGLGALETITAYALVDPYVPARLPADAAAYFNEVRRAPGEALLEWPFCIAGANGVGTKELCPYYGVQSTAYAYKRFYDKKVVSLYLSRLHESQVAPRMELATLFSPDDPDPHLARKETRCFDEAQWAHFDRIYREHDFAGIALYTDRLPPECVVQFHERYGNPKAKTNLPGPGNVEFLRRQN